ALQVNGPSLREFVPPAVSQFKMERATWLADLKEVASLQHLAVRSDPLVLDILLQGLTPSEAEIPEEEVLIGAQFICHLVSPVNELRSLTTLRIFSSVLAKSSTISSLGMRTTK